MTRAADMNRIAGHFKKANEILNSYPLKQLIHTTSSQNFKNFIKFPAMNS